MSASSDEKVVPRYPSAWAFCRDFGTHEIYGADCRISIEARVGWCDRGNWLARLDCSRGTRLAWSIDAADMWPRYYFDLERARLECEAWLKKRGQWVAP